MRNLIQITIKCSATLISLVIAATFWLLAADATFKASESNLTAAQIIGGGLALILSLSIVPAQRAAELFSSSVISLYAKDKPLLWAFLLLVVMTLFSILLGSDWRFVSPNSAIALQFILLGVSFDGLRAFYLRLLDLLVPQTGIRLIAYECAKWLQQSQRDVEKVVRYQQLAGIDHPVKLSKATAFAATGLQGRLLNRTAQLEEFALRFIARKETAAVIEIVATLGAIARRYTEIRASSTLLFLDQKFPFAGTISHISPLLNPIYESLLHMAEDAILSKNERIAKSCIEQLSELAQHARTVPVESNGITDTPLAFSACFYLTRSIRAVLKAEFVDATRAGIFGLQSFLQAADQMSASANSHAMEELLYIAREGYRRSDTLINFAAVEAVMRALQRQILLEGYSEGGDQAAMQAIAALIPAEAAYDAAGLRKLTIFPAYAPGFDASLLSLANSIADRIKLDPEWPEANPFDEFLECSEGMRSHFRSLTDVDFKNSLLRMWVVKSLLAIVRLHLTLATYPPEGTGCDVHPVIEAAGWLVSWVSGFFPQGAPADAYAEGEAVNGLSVAEGEYELALEIGNTIARMAGNSAATAPEPFRLADLQVPIEILARAADAGGASEIATTLRDKIERPSTVSDQNWPQFEAARKNRIDHLDRKLREHSSRHSRRDDPAERLRSFIAQSSRERRS